MALTRSTPLFPRRALVLKNAALDRAVEEAEKRLLKEGPRPPVDFPQGSVRLGLGGVSARADSDLAKKRTGKKCAARVTKATSRDAARG